MTEIKITGNVAIDTATAKIALAIGKWYPSGSKTFIYHEAERLRDAIMEGTREIDADMWERTDRPSVVVDHDGDEWKRNDEGLYECPGLAARSLGTVRHQFGPLYRPELES